MFINTEIKPTDFVNLSFLHTLTHDFIFQVPNMQGFKSKSEAKYSTEELALRLISKHLFYFREILST